MADFFDGIGNSLATLIGAKGGANYTPTFQNINEPVNPAQADIGYAQSLDALQKQAAFANAVMGGNPFAQQNALASQLQNQALGQGPNPALQQLQNATGQNVAQQASLMAGQRGAGSNAGLLARQIGNVGAGVQQQAAGQGALLQAQQQLAAQQALAQLSGQQAQQQQAGLMGYNQAAQSEQQQLLNSIAQANQQKTAMQQNINTVSGKLAEGQQQNTANAAGNIATAAGAAAQKIPWGSIFGGGSSGGAGGTSTAGGGFTDSETLGAAHGGMIKNYDAGGFVDNSTTNQSAMGPQSFVGRFLNGWGGSNIASAEQRPDAMSVISPLGLAAGLSGGGDEGGPSNLDAANAMWNSANLSSGLGKLSNTFAQQPMGNGTATPVVAGTQIPGNIQTPASDPISPPSDTLVLGNEPWNKGGGAGGFTPGMGGAFGGPGLAKGGAIQGENYAKQMKPVPGKAKVKGDSLKNDVVNAKLSPGEIIIPRSIAQSPDAPQKAAAFVQAILAKNGMRRGK